MNESSCTEILLQWGAVLRPGGNYGLKPDLNKWVVHFFFDSVCLLQVDILHNFSETDLNKWVVHFFIDSVCFLQVDILHNFSETTCRLVASSEYVSEYVSVLLNLASKQKKLFNRIAHQVIKIILISIFSLHLGSWYKFLQEESGKVNSGEWDWFQQFSVEAAQDWWGGQNESINMLMKIKRMTIRWILTNLNANIKSACFKDEREPHNKEDADWVERGSPKSKSLPFLLKVGLSLFISSWSSLQWARNHNSVQTRFVLPLQQLQLLQLPQRLQQLRSKPQVKLLMIGPSGSSQCLFISGLCECL